MSVIKIYVSRHKKVFPNNNYYDLYLEYENPENFKQWILSLKPKDLKDKGILKRTLYKIKHKIKQGKALNPKTKIVKILLQLYKDTKLNN